MGCTSLRTRDHGCCLVSTWNPRACRDCVVIRAHGCPGVITVDLDRTQEVAGSIPASSTLKKFLVLVSFLLFRPGLLGDCSTAGQRRVHQASGRVARLAR